MIIRRFFIATLISILLLSCGRTTLLSPDDAKWLPYTGKEVLVFGSSKGERDTIFNLMRDTLWGAPDYVDKYQIHRIFCSHTDALNNGGYRYLENDLVSLDSKNGRPRLIFFLHTKDANYYRLEGIHIDSLSEVQQTVLKTVSKTYNDVYIMENDDWMDFKSRGGYITKLYWSKSEGYVRYDMLDGTYWELINKYIL